MKKKIKLLILTLCCIIGSLTCNTQQVGAKTTYVKGYTRKDGTRVSGYYRNSSSSFSYDYSSKPSTYTVKGPVPTVSGSTYSQSTGSSLASGTGANASQSFSNIFYVEKRYVNLYRGTSFDKSVNTSSLVYVQGYYKKDGTYVRPHFRTNSNNYLYDNFSYQGLSSLTPLPVSQKYKYTYDSNANIQTTESYVLHNITAKKHALTEDEKQSIHSYASILDCSDCYVSEYGKTVYEAMGFSAYEASAMADYDRTGELTGNMYLCSVAQNLQLTISDEQAFLYDYYLAMLSLYTNHRVDYTSLVKAGEVVYQMLGLKKQEIYDQIEMDSLQKDLNFSGLSDQIIASAVIAVTGTNASDLNQYYTQMYNQHGDTIIALYIDYYLEQLKTVIDDVNEHNMEWFQYAGKDLFGKILQLSDEERESHMARDFTVSLKSHCYK